MTNRRHLPFWLLTAAFAAALMLPRIVTEGMFMDGLLYAVVARNLAAGVGAFWKPHCTDSLFPEFYEHPPIGLNIQSLFFRVFGDGFYVEGAFTLFTALATAAVIVALWRVLTIQRRKRRDLTVLSWLPVFFWLGIPQVAWAYSNNMLENTMSVFTLLAVYLVIRGEQLGAVGPMLHESRAAPRSGDAPRPRSRRAWAYTAAAGAAVCLAVLTKGPVGFFPLAAGMCYWAVTRRISFGRALAYSGVLLGVTAGLLAALMWFDGPRHNILEYVDTQLRTSLSGARGGHAFSPQILTKLLAEIAPPLGVAAIVWIVAWRRRALRVVDDVSRRAALLMLLVGLCGSVPIVVSPRQSGFYLLPSFPFYALSLALLIAPVLEKWTSRIMPDTRGARIFNVASWAVLLGAVIVGAAQFGKVGRDQALISDVKTVGRYVTVAGHASGDDADTAIGMCPDLWRHWSLHGYMARYFDISLDRSPEGREFVLVQESCDTIDLTAYEQIPLDTRIYQLYRRK